MQTQNKYSYPVEMTAEVKITADESPAHIGKLKHAVDFIVPGGTPIMAALDGTVVDVKQDSNAGGIDESFDQFGNYIEIKHAHDEYSIYEHISKDGSFVKIGDRVNAGQIIGYSGGTGWLAHLGPHLHFDVHKYIGNSLEEYETLEIGWIR